MSNVHRSNSQIRNEEQGKRHKDKCLHLYPSLIYGQFVLGLCKYKYYLFICSKCGKLRTAVHSYTPCINTLSHCPALKIRNFNCTIPKITILAAVFM